MSMTTSTQDRLWAAFEDYAQKPILLDTQYTLKCPAHDDRRASLSLFIRSEGRGMVLVLTKCWAGCTYEDITAAVGVTPDMAQRASRIGRASMTRQRQPDERPHTHQDPSVAQGATLFDIKGLDGETKAIKARFPGKSFGGWYRPCPAHEGQWLGPRLNGWPDVEDLPISHLPLYNTERLAFDPLYQEPNYLVICEGEKTADWLRWANEAALGTVTGASGCPDPMVLEGIVADRVVVLAADNDEIGRRHMDQIKRIIYPMAKEVLRYNHPEGRPTGWDPGDEMDYEGEVVFPAGYRVERRPQPSVPFVKPQPTAYAVVAAAAGA